LIKQPHGIIFVTGPTGSGKTTTLYACLSKINTDERKIITIEDPIEYELEGITQLQVLPKIGLSFSQGLRSMLRHDPDVMMVGEVRDAETAEIAIRVALTGHLVFSTLHTNDAASGITRLIDIGLEPYLVASSVEAFIGQRLVRVLCPHCKIEDKAALPELKKMIAEDLGLSSHNEVKIYKGKGCDKCNSTGFYGRTAVYEILLVDPEIRNLITGKSSSDEINNLAKSKGMLSMRQNGWRRVISGVTTPGEVLKVTQSEVFAIESIDHAPTLKKEKNPNIDLEKVEEIVKSSQDSRRDFARLDVRMNVRYKVVKCKDSKRITSIEHNSVTENISAGGLVFLSNQPLPKETILEFKIELSGQAKPIQCLCKVVRVEEVIVNKTYDIAVCFLDISGAERTRFNKFVIEKLSEGLKEI